MARAGQKILHLDVSNYYGGADASLSVAEFLTFATTADSSPYTRKELVVSAPDTQEFKALNRRFSIDLNPRLVYATGSTVDSMIQGGVSQYLEFKPVVSGVMWQGDRFAQLPCNKSEIFQNQDMSLREKRALMRLLEAIPTLQDGQKSFDEVLAGCDLSPKLRNIVMYGLLYRLDESEEMSTHKAVERIMVLFKQKYANSLNLYKENTSMLYPLFGSADVPQAFCRLAAVYGSVYILSTDLHLESLHSTSESLHLPTSMGELECQRVILSSRFISLDPESRPVVSQQLLRMVLVTSAAAYESDGPVMLSVPPSDSVPVPVYILQVTNNTSCVPDGYTIYYLWARLREESRAALEAAASLLPGEVTIKAVYQQDVVGNGAESRESRVWHVKDVEDGVDLDAHFVHST